MQLDAALKKDTYLQGNIGSKRKTGTMPSRVNRVLWSFFYPLLAFWIYLVPLSLYAATVPAGDVAPYGSADGQLNAADAVIIQRFIFGDLTPTANELLIGDVAPLGAPDGVLNAADMAILMRAIIGEILLDPVTVPPASPTLNGSDATTNTNPYIITGTAIPGIDVNLYINGQQQATTTASDGSFTFLAALFDGNNVIYVTAQDGAGESVPSDNILSIEYINIIPRTQSDPISTDTVWTPGSPTDPYVINGEIIIASGASLTIQPGTVLEFGSGGWITVNGTLNVQGTLNEKVTFTSSAPGVNNWSGINVNASATNVLIDHAIIEYAGYGISFNNGTGTVSNSIIQNNGGGIYIYDGGATPLITRNIITANQRGLYVLGTGFAGGNPNPVVTGNRIYDNLNYIGNPTNYITENFYDPSNTILDARGNWWGSIDPGVIATGIGDYTDDPLYLPYVDYSDFLDVDGTVTDPTPISFNSLYVIDGNVVLLADTTYIAMGDIIIDSGESLTIPSGVTIEVPGDFQIIVNGSLDVQGTDISKVTFTSGKATPASGDWKGIVVNSGATGVVIDHAIIEYATNGVYFNNGTGTVSNSLIQNNDRGIKTSDIGAAPSITGNIIRNNIDAYGIGYGIEMSGGTAPQVIDNDIVENNYGIGAWGIGDNASNNPDPVVTGNRIDNIVQNFSSSGFFDPAQTVLNATGNWWGSTNPGAIAVSIIDNTDGAGSPYVDYSGFLDGDGVPVAINPLYVIDGTVTLTAGLTYTVLGNITIESGESLIIPAGVTILLPGEAGYGSFGITVNGTLTVQGSETDKVVFTSDYYQPLPDFLPDYWVAYNWDGITVNSTATVSIDHAVIEYASDGAGGGAGISFINVGGSLSNSLLQYNASGIYIEGASNPSLSNNTIINNELYGIHLKGTGNDAANPQPIINNNDIYGNASAQIYIENYGVSSAIIIDMTSNWWGTDTPTVGTVGGSDQIQFGGNMPAAPETTVNYSGPMASSGQGPGLTGVALDQVYFSPGNSTGVQDTTTFSGTLSEAADSWSVTLRNVAGSIIKTYTGSGTSVSATWDGTNDSSVMQADGSYYFAVTATVGGRTSQSGYRYVVMDNTAPYDVVASIDEPPYINFTNIKVTFDVKGAYQMMQSELADFSDATWSSINLPQSLTLSEAEGTRTIYVKFKDRAGNETQTSTSVVMDLTPPTIAVTSPENGAIF